MDKIKTALAWLKKYHFWVLSLLVLVLATGAWFSASSAIATAFESNQNKINKEFSDQKNLGSKSPKVNDDINARQGKEIAQLADGVRSIWAKLYDRQKEAVLKWPKQLGSKFAKYVENKGFGDKINNTWRDRYLNYIQKRFPDLLAIVDAEDLGESGRGGGRSRGGLGGPMMEMGGLGGRGARGGTGEPIETHTVEWLDQGVLRARLNLDKRPSALQIWVLQEDLWVYETLLQEIADANRSTGATRRDRTAVRSIVQLQVGRNAAGGNASSGRLFIPQDLGPSPGGGMGMGMMGMGMEMGGMGMEMGGMGMEMGGGGMGMEMGGGMGMGGGMMDMSGVGSDEGSILLAGRYVDETGAPIMSVSEDYQFGVEYKRLPVRMVLEMDRRHLPSLIVELANAPLQVEVEQVRVNPSDSGNNRRRGSGGNGSIESFDRKPTVGTVVLQGVVYIFNQPDEAVLAVDEDSDEI